MSEKRHGWILKNKVSHCELFCKLFSWVAYYENGLSTDKTNVQVRRQQIRNSGYFGFSSELGK